MGLLKTENFVDRVFITVTATGVAATGLSPTCTIIDESDNRTAGTVAEMSNGWYKITDFTPDADGTWCTEWAVTGAYTIHYPYKEFKVGLGQEAAIKTETALIVADTNELQNDMKDGGRIDLLIDAIKSKTDNLPSDPADDSDIDSQLSTINTNVLANKDVLDGQDTILGYLKRRIVSHIDYWSDIQEEAQIGAGDESGVIALPDVTVEDLPTGCVIQRVIAMFLCRAIENTNASANAIDVATGHIEVRDDSPGSWTTAINIPDNAFGVAASTREMGTVIIGDNDISGSGKVDGHDTYNFQFDDIGADYDHLNFNDIQVGLRIYFYTA